jgi:hypothetical protein
MVPWPAVRGSRARTGEYRRGARLAMQGGKPKVALQHQPHSIRLSLATEQTECQPHHNGIALRRKPSAFFVPIGDPARNVDQLVRAQRRHEQLMPALGPIPCRPDSACGLERCGQSGLGDCLVWLTRRWVQEGALALTVIGLVQEHDSSETRGCRLGRDFDSLTSAQLTSGPNMIFHDGDSGPAVTVFL